MAAGEVPGPVCEAQTFTPIDDGTMCRAHSPLPGPLGTSPSIDYLRDALDDFAASARNFGAVFIKDARARGNYVRKIEQMSKEILADVRAGRETAEAGAEFARQMRDAIMEETRRQSSSIGRAAAQAMKPSGTTLAQLIEEKAAKLFPGKTFTNLAKAERRQIFEEIIESAGRSRPAVTAMISRWRLLGRGCLLFTAGIAIYNVWTADNKIEAGLNEAIVFGGGAAGGALAGAATGLVCGPGAPFCSMALFIVGGIMGALAAQTATTLYADELRDFATWFGEFW
jgi:hypothetical protein